MADTNFGWSLLQNGQPIGQLIKIGDFSLNTDELESTHHGSVFGGIAFKEYISSKLNDFDKIPATFTATQAVVNALRTAQMAGEVDTYTMTFPGDLEPLSFNAFVTMSKLPEADAQGVELLTVDVEFRPTPPYDFDGSSSGS